MNAFLQLLVFITSIICASQCSATPPDIVVFLSDDHTITDSSLYGSTDLRTPNMERIAATGMTFDRAFVVSPSCAPSRAALLTGLMPSRNGAEANHSRPGAEIQKLPKYLQDLGYEVVSFGKVGHYVQTPEYGFDLARHFTYHDDVCVSEAVKWLKQRESSKPLCLFVGSNWPHVPWPEASEYDPQNLNIPDRHVDTQETRNARASYYEAVHTMDQELGLVFDTARKKLGEDILFIHTSDHGPQWPFGKWNLYEDGIRTPLIVSWAGQVAAGIRSNALVSWVDLLPTIVEAAGGKPPETIDGKSIMPVLTGKSLRHRDAVFTVHSGDGNMNVYPMRSMRTERWKYVLNLHPEFRFNSHVTRKPGDTGYWPGWVERARTDGHAADVVRRYQQRPGEELFDLDSDPREQNNLAADPAFINQLEQMRARLAAWMESQGDTKTVFGMPDLLPTDRLSSNGRRPNIITFFIDDMGWADLSCFGGTAVQTVNIDRLAAEGIRFTNFYVNSPICSPSRTALTTGLYPARHRITSFLSNRQDNTKRGMAQWLDVNAVTLPGMLSGDGYACGHFGKWHMGGQRDVGEAPLITEYGFAVSMTNFEGLGHRVLPLKDAFDGRPAVPHALGSDKLGRGPIEWEDRSRITQRFVERAIQFIDDPANQDKPLFINVWPDDVHSPFFPPGERRGDNSKQMLYHGVLKTMDEQLGVLMDRIRDDVHLKENTLILLASDNGPENGAGSAGVLRGSKGELWEGGIRSPLIVWGPGFLKKDACGTTNVNTIISSIDLVASLITFTGVTPPDRYRPDGENLLAALLGISSEQRTDPLFWRRPPDRPSQPDNYRPDLAVRDKEWKLVCRLDGTSAQLFNLIQDPSESTDAAAGHPRITKRLTDLVVAWNQTLPEDATTIGAISTTVDQPGGAKKKKRQGKGTPPGVGLK